MLDFTLIEILPECKYRKNLESGKYPLGKYGVKNFYGENVSLHAIVGKNGSGKSSLLDLMLRIVNNVGALMCKQEIRDASEHVKYVRHIYADLSYEKSIVNSMKGSDGVHHGKICVRDTVLWIEYDTKIYMLSDNILIDKSENGQNYVNALKTRHVKWQYEDYSDMRQTDTKQYLASMLFYTIATNYSMLGFQSDDYADEDSLEFSNDLKVVDNDGAIYVDQFNRPYCVSGWAERKNWITGLFHKNDGYMCPIVLNPYRDEGHINMKNEAHLTESRLSALFINEQMDEKPIIDDYYLDYIKYETNDTFYLKFKPIVDEKDKNVNLLANGGDLSFFLKAAKKERSTSGIVLNLFGFPIEDNLSDFEIKARLYIVYKVLSIAAAYPYYSDYKKYGKIDRVFEFQKLPPTPNLFRKLVNEIKNRHTHIEHKIHQTLAFLRKVESYKQLHPEDADMAWLNRSFKYSEYRERFNLSKQFNSIEECMDNLPPSIFRQSIFLKQVVDGNIAAHDIPLSRMSSGQKQMLYQLSTLIYHALNLKSVPKHGLHYYNLNIILDEIEVCFHPEYQRMFISRLLDLLCDKLHLNEEFGIHIWLTTHSPFILSDIPEDLIVYLKDGHQLNEQEKKTILPPMAANISDLLHQSFFLENGFIGEYARQKIISLVKDLRDKPESSYWDKDSASLFIKGISEPYISNKLREMYRNRYEKDIY